MLRHCVTLRACFLTTLVTDKIIATLGDGAMVLDGWMSVEQRWNDTDRGKLMCWEKDIMQCEW